MPLFAPLTSGSPGAPMQTVHAARGCAKASAQSMHSTRARIRVRIPSEGEEDRGTRPGSSFSPTEEWGRRCRGATDEWALIGPSPLIWPSAIFSPSLRWGRSNFGVGDDPIFRATRDLRYHLTAAPSVF